MDRRPVEPFAGFAVFAAFVLMVFPVGADIHYSLFRARMFAIADVFLVGCFLIVFIPFLLSCRRLRREPDRWRGRGWLIAVGVVLAFYAAGTILAFWSRLG